MYKIFYVPGIGPTTTANRRLMVDSIRSSEEDIREYQGSGPVRKLMVTVLPRRTVRPPVGDWLKTQEPELVNFGTSSASMTRSDASAANSCTTFGTITLPGGGGGGGGGSDPGVVRWMMKPGGTV
jgi:hypothetical protein